MQILNFHLLVRKPIVVNKVEAVHAIYLENSFVRMDTVSITDNSYGAFLRSSSGYLTNSTITSKCNAIDTNSHLVTNGQQYTFVISDNTITPTEGAGITAYDGVLSLLSATQSLGHPKVQVSVSGRPLLQSTTTSLDQSADGMDCGCTVSQMFLQKTTQS